MNSYKQIDSKEPSTFIINSNEFAAQFQKYQKEYNLLVKLCSSHRNNNLAKEIYRSWKTEVKQSNTFPKYFVLKYQAEVIMRGRKNFYMAGGIGNNYTTDVLKKDVNNSYAQPLQFATLGLDYYIAYLNGYAGFLSLAHANLFIAYLLADENEALLKEDLKEYLCNSSYTYLIRPLSKEIWMNSSQLLSVDYILKLDNFPFLDYCKMLYNNEALYYLIKSKIESLINTKKQEGEKSWGKEPNHAQNKNNDNQSANNTQIAQISQTGLFADKKLLNSNVTSSVHVKTPQKNDTLQAQVSFLLKQAKCLRDQADLFEQQAHELQAQILETKQIKPPV